MRREEQDNVEIRGKWWLNVELPNVEEEQR